MAARITRPTRTSRPSRRHSAPPPSRGRRGSPPAAGRCCSRPPASLPRKASLPSTSRAMRSPTRRARGMSWVTTTEVTPSSLLDRVDQLADGRRGDRVEAGGRLVEQHHLGVEGQRAGEGDALAHPSREVGGHLPARCRLQPHLAELLADACRRSPPRSARCARAAGRRRCRRRSSSRTGRRSGTAWRCAGGRGRARASPSCVRSVPSKTTRAGLRLLQAVELAQGHALAGPRAAEDHQALALAGCRSRGRRGSPGRHTSWSGRGSRRGASRRLGVLAQAENRR